MTGILNERQFSKPQMDALQFDPRRKQLALVKKELPGIVEKNEVIVKIAYAGLCGTDLHILEGKFPTNDRPLILGHEFCGLASSLGSEVKHIKRGDKVVIDPESCCNVCSFCTTGSYHLCETGGINSTIGIFSNGGWAQFCKVPARQVYRVPDGMLLKQVVLCEPLSCIIHAWEKIGQIEIGSHILIIGAGIIGNLWCSVLHHAGHRKVTVSEPFSVRREFNRKLETNFNCVSPDDINTMKNSREGFGVDLCIDCSGNGQAIQDAISLLRPGGKLCIFGVSSPDTKISVSPYEMYKKELTIVGVVINQFSIPKALSLIEAMGDRYLNYEKLGIQEYSMEQHQEALNSLKKGNISKVVFKITSEKE
uniref:Enoyl reductase (ER) domain-containing protein n=1 Tax=Clastoptera arizonana TaxID=38151 RepID=A0A1B6DVG1_9HEMI